MTEADLRECIRRLAYPTESVLDTIMHLIEGYVAASLTPLLEKPLEDR